MFELSATAMWVIGGLVVGIFSLVNKYVFGKIYKELEINKSDIANKADAKHLLEAESRWKDSLETVRSSNNASVDKLESRHDRELLELGNRLGEQISRSEDNILSQIRLMVDALSRN